MTHPRIGIWLIGARGGVAATTLVGLTALEKRLVQPVGLVSALPDFSALPLAAWSDFVVGGHEIRDVRLVDEALRLANESRAIDRDLIARCRAELEAIDGCIRPGALAGVGPTIESFADARIPRGELASAAIRRIQADLKEFIAREQVEHLVVVNVASTEPPADVAGLPAVWAELEPLLDDRDCPLPASSLYAIAALDLGCSYVNFTPSLGSSPAAIGQLAVLRGTRHMGCDGKTGETLLKSVLAPMFRQRNLEVKSWVGHNIFGNMDGRVLNDPRNKSSKVASKSRLLGQILGYQPQALVSIEFIESLGDWKTAWDHIHFDGFLGTRMTMQFIWQGCDSLLAAPLVLDLVRFTDLARRRGRTGLLTFLASFFKSPYGVDEHRFDRQYQMLETWAAEGEGGIAGG
jgi:myo-inositol-1-phosphate synthase